jgi:hypothetical protein
MRKLLLILVFVVVIIGACHLLSHAQTPPTGPQPPNPMPLFGRVTMTPDLTIWNTAMAAQQAAGNVIIGGNSASGAVRADGEKRVSDMLAQYRTIFPNTYKALMIKCKCRLTDDTF